MTIDISGTAGQVSEAFHTEMQRYNMNGTASSISRMPATRTFWLHSRL
jgi:hypothetical protein